jgi:tRNA (mo5U34)-methyltransferase
MLRSAGFTVLEHPEDEVFVCKVGERPKPWGAVYPARPRTNGHKANGRGKANGGAR